MLWKEIDKIDHVQELARITGHIKANLTKDYYVVIKSVGGDMHPLYIAMRFAFMSVYYLILRVCHALDEYILKIKSECVICEQDTAQLKLECLAHIFQPNSELYETLSPAGNMLRPMYDILFSKHFTDLLVSSHPLSLSSADSCLPIGYADTTLQCHISIDSTNEQVDTILSKVAMLASYPCIPDEMFIQNIPFDISEKTTNLVSEGGGYVRSVPEICPLCRYNSLCVGHTDFDELVKHTKCSCTFINIPSELSDISALHKQIVVSDIQKKSVQRCSTIQRLLGLYHIQVLKKNHMCASQEHQAILLAILCKLKKNLMQFCRLQC